MSEAVAAAKGKSKKMSVSELTTIGLMTGILIVMSFTPLGYFRTMGLDISLMMIPVGIGAMLIGPRAGLWLGFIFGATSFYQTMMGSSPVMMMLFNINPVFTFLLCIPTRMLMGWLTGMIFKGVHKVDRSKTISYFIGGFSAAFLNTVFFMGALMLFFWNTSYIQELNASLGGLNPIMFVVAFVGVNGLLEMPASCVVGGIISKAVNRAFFKK